MLRLPLKCLRRFIPPWEKAGLSAESFFGGLMQSGNPMQRRMRDELRNEEASKAEQAAEAASSLDLEKRQSALESYAEQCGEGA